MSKRIAEQRWMNRVAELPCVRDLTWKAIAGWFHEQGAPFSVAQLRQAHRDWELKGRSP